MPQLGNLRYTAYRLLCDLTRERSDILSEGEFLVGYLLLIHQQQSLREALGNFYIFFFFVSVCWIELNMYPEGPAAGFVFFFAEGGGGSENVQKRLLASSCLCLSARPSVCLYVCPHGTARLPVDGPP